MFLPKSNIFFSPMVRLPARAYPVVDNPKLWVIGEGGGKAAEQVHSSAVVSPAEGGSPAGAPAWAQ